MGSIEVYDCKEQKWVPYIPDPNKWYIHFKDLSKGHVRPDHLGRYIVGSGEQQRDLVTKEEKRPVVKLVSPVAQATEIAKSEVTRKNECGSNKRKKVRERYFGKGSDLTDVKLGPSNSKRARFVDPEYQF